MEQNISNDVNGQFFRNLIIKASTGIGLLIVFLIVMVKLNDFPNGNLAVWTAIILFILWLAHTFYFTRFIWNGFNPYNNIPAFWEYIKGGKYLLKKFSLVYFLDWLYNVIFGTIALYFLCFIVILPWLIWFIIIMCVGGWMSIPNNNIRGKKDPEYYFDLGRIHAIFGIKKELDTYKVSAKIPYDIACEQYDNGQKFVLEKYSKFVYV